MKLDNLVLLVVIFMVRHMDAQPFVASMQYTLHAEKQAHSEAVAVIAPNQSLITISGKKEGDWTLTRLNGWSTPSPTEETIQIKGFPLGRVSGWSDSAWADLVVSPDGRYAIARIQTSAPGMLSAVRKNTEAVVTVVDLNGFKVLSTNDTTDPLLAGSSWQFELNGVLVSTIGAAEKTTQQQALVLQRAAVLSLPRLDHEIICTYKQVYGPILQSRSDPQRKASTADVSESCAPFLKMAGLTSIAELTSQGSEKRHMLEQLNYRRPGFSYLGSDKCGGVGMSKDRRLALYACAAAHPTWYDTVKTTALSYVVVSVPGAIEVGSVAADPRKRSTAMLSNLDGQNFLLILEDVVHLAVYKIKTPDGEN